MKTMLHWTMYLYNFGVLSLFLAQKISPSKRKILHMQLFCVIVIINLDIHLCSASVTSSLQSQILLGLKQIDYHIRMN